jgi:RNA polymerase sigma factor (sigma-70 family)
VINKDLIQSVKQHDKRAFKELYECCIRYVYSIVQRYVSNDSDHKDVIQEIFARVFLSIDSFDEKKGEFKPWLRRLTINQCIQHFHKQNASVKVIPLDTATHMEFAQDDQLNAMTKDELLQLLQHMPNGYKQVFMMVVIDEYSHVEVSKILHISPETSRTQLHRAKKWLSQNFLSNNSKTLVSGI